MRSGLFGFDQLVRHGRDRLRRAPRDDLMSQLIQITESDSDETYLDDTEAETVAGLVLATGFDQNPPELRDVWP